MPWAVEHKYIDTKELEELKKIKKIKINPRRVRIPSIEVVDEFLRMVATEYLNGSEFLRFLAETGLRKAGALELNCEDIDFQANTINVKQKKGGGGWGGIIPISQEAISILKNRKNLHKPFAFTEFKLRKLGRLMKKYAKGYGIDLSHYHALRHYFASKCLQKGLTVQEVATLLGHSDGGQQVLSTYDHICNTHLVNQVSKLRLSS